MATSIAIGFPWGRYHATPWGRHVNEGAVEWPPSPWRLLRALYATWRARCPELDPALVHELLAALGGLPSFVLPVSSEGHTRHYLPDAEHLGSVRNSTDKALDAFAVVERGAEVTVTWHVDLEGRHREALSRLCSLIPYVGRAESMCEVRLLGAEDTLPSGIACAPRDADGPADDRHRRPTRVLVPRTPLDVAALVVRTTEVRGARRMDPPGAYWALYDPEAGDGASRPGVIVPDQSRMPCAVRWSVSGAALPSRHAAVALGDILRQACLSRYGKLTGGGVSAVLAGKAPDGAPLRDHQHAHYLATDDDRDGLIDHLTLWAPGGLGAQEVAALVRVDRLTGFGHIADFRPVRLALEALGPAEAVAPGLAGPACRWVSATPFAPARHPHRDAWEEHLRRSVVDELRWRALPTPADVGLVDGPWLDFRRHRPTTERLAGARRAAGIRLVFDEPVLGPIVIGGLSHFGLGMLVSESDDGRLG